MAGRWVMATIQMSFSIMPAAVYWFGGWWLASGHPISIGTLVSFTTLQSRLFFPVGGLLSVGIWGWPFFRGLTGLLRRHNPLSGGA